MVEWAVNESIEDLYVISGGGEMDAEKWLKYNCFKEDFDKLTDGNLNDFISTNNVIRYMERFSILEMSAMSGNRIIKCFIDLIISDIATWEKFKAHNPDTVNKLKELLDLWT